MAAPSDAVRLNQLAYLARVVGGTIAIIAGLFGTIANGYGTLWALAGRNIDTPAIELWGYPAGLLLSLLGMALGLLVVARASLRGVIGLLLTAAGLIALAVAWGLLRPYGMETTYFYQPLAMLIAALIALKGVLATRSS